MSSFIKRIKKMVNQQQINQNHYVLFIISKDKFMNHHGKIQIINNNETMEIIILIINNKYHQMLQAVYL